MKRGMFLVRPVKNQRLIVKWYRIWKICYILRCKIIFIVYKPHVHYNGLTFPKFSNIHKNRQHMKVWQSINEKSRDSLAVCNSGSMRHVNISTNDCRNIYTFGFVKIIFTVRMGVCVNLLKTYQCCFHYNSVVLPLYSFNGNWWS